MKLTSTGDVGIWLAPHREGDGVQPVLRCTTLAGTTIEIALTTGDVLALAENAADIVNASTEDVQTWLDDAARAISRSSGVTGQGCGKNDGERKTKTGGLRTASQSKNRRSGVSLSVSAGETANVPFAVRVS